VSRLRRPTRSFDDRFYTAVAEIAVEQGWDQESDEIPDASDAVQQVAERFTTQVKDYLLLNKRRFMRGERAQHRKFQRRLRKFWGDALDSYQALMYSSGEAAMMLSETIDRSARTPAEVHVEAALFSIHARALRVTFEVFHLLSGGFPSGALARCRTLHELAVTAMVLGEYGLQAQFPDLAERFLLHHRVTDKSDVREYQDSYVDLKMAPFNPAEMEEVEKLRDEVLTRFGTPYKETYGWAAPLFPTVKRVDFRDLEKLANIAHMRSYYKWSSHEIHSDSKGIRLNIAERAGQVYHRIGAVNFGLADSGQFAMISLGQCTVTVLLRAAAQITPLGLVLSGALQSALQEALDEFAAAEKAVAAAEERVNGAPDSIVGRFGIRRVRVKPKGIAASNQP
jgi:hypothetical protein